MSALGAVLPDPGWSDGRRTHRQHLSAPNSSRKYGLRMSAGSVSGAEFPVACVLPRHGRAFFRPPNPVPVFATAVRAVGPKWPRCAAPRQLRSTS